MFNRFLLSSTLRGLSVSYHQGSLVCLLKARRDWGMTANKYPACPSLKTATLSFDILLSIIWSTYPMALCCFVHCHYQHSSYAVCLARSSFQEWEFLLFNHPVLDKSQTFWKKRRLRDQVLVSLWELCLEDISANVRETKNEKHCPNRYQFLGTWWPAHFYVFVICFFSFVVLLLVPIYLIFVLILCRGV